MARKVRREPKKKLSVAAWFGIGCGAVFALGIVVVAIFWILVKAGPALPPEATARATPPSAAPAPGAAGEQPSQPSAPGEAASASPAAPSPPPLRQQLQYVEQAARSDQPRPIRVTIREDELNSLIAQEASQDVQNMRVYFGDGTIAGTGNVTWKGQTVALTVRARPIVSGGQLDVQVLEVRVGRIGAPAAVHEEVRKQMSRNLQKLVSQRNAQIQSVTVRPDVMTVSGQVGGR